MAKFKSWVIRAYLPKADAAWVVCPEARTEYSMQSLHHPNFFVCTIENPQLANYQLRVKEGDQEKVIHDPYAFSSSQLTDFDIHLFAEGNHHRIYEKLGRIYPVNGVKGVYFAVWAPNARNASVLGDFNNWDGRETPNAETGAMGFGNYLFLNSKLEQRISMKSKTGKDISMKNLTLMDFNRKSDQKQPRSLPT